MRALLLAAALLVAAPLAQAEAGAGATRLSVVAYHPFPETVPPEDGGDPLGFPATNASARPADWMAAYYGAYYYPTVRFDGVLEEANRADSNAASYLEAYRGRLLSRLAHESPVVLFVNGTLAAREGALTVRATSFANLTGERLVLRAALVEDDLPFPGKNGVLLHRFVARATLPERTIEWTPVDASRWAFEVRYEFTAGLGLDGLPWRAGFLGAVAWVQKEGEAARFEPREVVQSATFLFRDAPRATVQVDKAPLVEMYTATWCEACVYGDGAVDLLLEEFGRPTTVRPASAWAYLREPDAAHVALALLVGLPAAWFVARRRP